ncbi:MAG: ROK family protein [Acidobacteria bacterium]|nr:ROK family protein [Acidobacteriota bacterium]
MNTTTSAIFTRNATTQLEKTYTVQLVDGLLNQCPNPLIQAIDNRPCLLVTTPTVANLYGNSLVNLLEQNDIRHHLLILECAEEAKSLGQVSRIAEVYYQHALGRTAILIGFGGGVCTDLVTMAASLIRRGLDTIRIPTTLIGQIDASIGIKGAVNFMGRKSALGCYHPPRAVFIDPSFLTTLPTSLLQDGMAEIVKMAMVRDAELMDMLRENGLALLADRFLSEKFGKTEILRRAIFRMLEELESNFHENKTYKRLVDFGHFLSPKLEAVSGYQLSHGQAVAIDMVYSAALGCGLGITQEHTFRQLVQFLDQVGLPTDSPFITESLMHEAIRDATLHRGGQVNLVVPYRPGEAYFVSESEDLTPAIVRQAIQRVRTLSGPILLAKREHIVMDIGGTHLRAGLFRNGQIENMQTWKTPSLECFPSDSPERLYQRLIDLVQACVQSMTAIEPHSIGIAFAGPLDNQQRVLAAPTLWGKTLKPIDLRKDLQVIWPNSRIDLFNDVSAAGYRFAQPKGPAFCVITVSSGIGNKVFIDGQPVLGALGQGGELGHWRVDYRPDAPLCDCGGRGHLGAIASGRGTLRTAHARAKADPQHFKASQLGRSCDQKTECLTNELLAAAFQAGDPWTHAVVRKCAAPLGRAIGNLHLNLGCERFVMIGGFARALGESYRQILVEAAAESDWQQNPWNEWIELGDADDFSGLIGVGIAMTQKRETL